MRFIMLIFMILSLQADESLHFFTLEKYNQSYESFDKQAKARIEAEYKTTLALASRLEQNQLKNSPLLKTAHSMTTVSLWSNAFLNHYQPTQAQLQELYTATNPKLPESYLLHSIKVQYEASANKILKELASTKEPKQRLELFQKLVHKYSIDIKSKKNKGALGIIEVKNLKPSVQNALKKTKQADVTKAFVEDDGWYILYIEAHNPTKNATFDQAKPALIQLAKRQALQKEIQRIINP